MYALDFCPSNTTRMFPTKHWTTLQNSF